VAVAAGCSRDFPEKVSQTIKRPGGDVIAIVTDTEGPATVSDGNRIYLALSKSPDDRWEVLRYDKGVPPEVTWADATHLAIKVQCAQIYRYTNFADVWPNGREKEFERITVLLENHGLCPR
jgi:hypothetical protein